MKTNDAPEVAIGAPSESGHRFVRAGGRVFGVAPISDTFRIVELEPGESKFVITENNLRVKVITIKGSAGAERVITDAVQRILSGEIVPTMELQISSFYASKMNRYAKVRFFDYGGVVFIDIDNDGKPYFHVEGDNAMARAITEGWLEECGSLWTDFMEKTVREDLGK